MDTEPAANPKTDLSAASQSVIQYWNEKDSSGIELSPGVTNAQQSYMKFIFITLERTIHMKNTR